MARHSLSHDQLLAGIREGDSRALARAISMVENADPGAQDLVSALYPETGGAVAIGVTGPPGAGKSSLIAALIHHVRGLGKTVGVVSVDPSSPFTHGALLGDRIRLADHFLDPGVFIRSMGSRGHLGGLAEATLQALLLLDAAGRDVIFLETVGTGQSDVEVVGIADLVVLVLMPGSGDSVQALKAGIMEIPDLIVINKSDQPGAKAMLGDVRSVLALDPDLERRPQLLATDAVGGEGVAQLWNALDALLSALAEGGELELRRRRNLAGEVIAVAAGRARDRIERALASDEALRELLAAVERRELDPLTAVSAVIDSVFPADPSDQNDTKLQSGSGSAADRPAGPP